LEAPPPEFDPAAAPVPVLDASVPVSVSAELVSSPAAASPAAVFVCRPVASRPG
jgi:hypothetical protein